MAPTTQTKSNRVEDFDDFEVVGSLETKSLKTIDALAAQLTTMVAQYQEGNTASIEKLHEALQSLTTKVTTRNTTNDRRIRTLESCFDDCESSITETNTAVNKLQKQIGSQSAHLATALDALGENVVKTEIRSKDNSTRLDRMVIKYLPSVEAKLQNVKESQSKQAMEVDAKFDDFRRTMDGITPSEVMDIRRIAAEANIRSRMLEKTIPNIKTDVLMAVAAEVSEIECANSEARDRAEDRLVATQAELTDKMQHMEDTVNRGEMIVQYIAAKVTPQFQKSIEGHDEILVKLTATVARLEKNLAAEIEAKYIDRIRQFEKDADRIHSLAVKYEKMEERLAQLEGSSIPVAPPMKSRGTSLAVPEYSLENSLRAEIMKREIHAELTKRQRNKILSGKGLNATVLRGEIMRRSLLKEIRARHQRREVRAVKAELMRRSILAEMKKRNIRRQVRAVKAEILRRDLVAEIKVRHQRPLIKKQLVTPEQLANEISKRRLMRSIFASPPAVTDAAPAKPARVTSLTLNLKTLTGEGVTLQVPPFVSCRYLKQLVYFRTGCNMHPTSQNLVYAGRVLKDTWRVGGGMFVGQAGSGAEEEFTGIKDNATVLIVVKKPFLG